MELAIIYFFLDILIGLLRLRKCSENTFRSELTGGVSIVRELHVYPFRTFHVLTHQLVSWNDFKII